MSDCVICGSSVVSKEFIVKEMMFGTKDLFTYLECGDCGCLRIKDLPVDLVKYYPDNYYSFKNTKSNPLKSYLISLRDKQSIGFNNLLGKILTYRFPASSHIKILKFINPNLGLKILDVGSGVGDKLLALRRIGFTRLLGIDPYIEEDINYKNNILVIKKSLSEIEDSFDLILFNHSLEHMEDPLSVLNEVQKKITTNSFVIIRLPVAGGFAWRCYGSDWVQIDAPRHIFIPTRKSMIILAERCGFRVVKTLYDSSSFQFFASEQYQKGIPLTSSQSYSVNSKKSIFTKKEINDFALRSEKLNAEEDGDQACFILKKN